MQVNARIRDMKRAGQSVAVAERRLEKSNRKIANLQKELDDLDGRLKLDKQQVARPDDKVSATGFRSLNQVKLKIYQYHA